jgi:hypothetical protein
VRKRFDELPKPNLASVHHLVDDLWAYPGDVRRSFRFQSDHHMTPLAHRIVGESLAKIVAPALGEK